MKVIDKIKYCALMVLAICLVQVLPAQIVYQDNFDNDTLATNTGTGGGGAQNVLDAGQTWQDDGNLSLNVTNGNFNNSAFFYTTNAFQSSGGFTLEVDYSYALENGGANKFGIGLISDDTVLSAVTGTQNFFGSAATNDSLYSLGVSMTNNAGTIGLHFSNGVSTSNLDVSTGATFAAATNLVIDIGPAGAWSYSLGGISQGSGTIAGGFDLSKNYHVVVFSQDDQSAKSVQSITLTAVPEPGTFALLACGLGSLLLLRRHKS